MYVPDPWRDRHDAHRRERAQAGADRRPAHADLRPRGRARPAAGRRAQLTALDQVAHVRHHLLGAAFRSGEPSADFGPGNGGGHDW